MGERAGGDHSLWVRQWMSSVFGTEKETSSSEGLREMFRKRFCRRHVLDLCDGNATVREKSSTYETMMPVGMRVSSWPFFILFLFFYVMYSLLRYKNSHAALAMA